MPRKSFYTEKTESIDIFQAFTDLMSNAFMILCLLLLLALIQSQKLNQNLQKANLETLSKAELIRRIEKLQVQRDRALTASPIIIDEKSGEFKFTSGSAELNPKLQAKFD